MIHLPYALDCMGAVSASVVKSFYRNGFEDTIALIFWGLLISGILGIGVYCHKKRERAAALIRLRAWKRDNHLSTAFYLLRSAGSTRQEAVDIIFRKPGVSREQANDMVQQMLVDIGAMRSRRKPNK